MTIVARDHTQTRALIQALTAGRSRIDNEPVKLSPELLAQSEHRDQRFQKQLEAEDAQRRFDESAIGRLHNYFVGTKKHLKDTYDQYMKKRWRDQNPEEAAAEDAEKEYLEDLALEEKHNDRRHASELAEREKKFSRVLAPYHEGGHDFIREQSNATELIGDLPSFSVRYDRSHFLKDTDLVSLVNRKLTQMLNSTFTVSPVRGGGSLFRLVAKDRELRLVCKLVVPPASYFFVGFDDETDFKEMLNNLSSDHFDFNHFKLKEFGIEGAFPIIYKTIDLDVAVNGVDHNNAKAGYTVPCKLFVMEDVTTRPYVGNPVHNLHSLTYTERQRVCSKVSALQHTLLQMGKFNLQPGSLFTDFMVFYYADTDTPTTPPPPIETEREMLVYHVGPDMDSIQTLF